MRVELTHELVSGASKAPPTEFRLLKNGVNETTKGPINLTEASKAAVIERIKADGRDQNRLSFDFNHLQVLGNDADAGRSAGWFSVEARDDGLWIVNAEWTETAFAQISAREWRFFSPVLMLDAKTREPIQLVNVALTNLPATKDQTPLVASQTVGDGQSQKDPLVDEKAVLKLFGALGVSDAAGAEAHVVALSAEVETLKTGAVALSAEVVSLKADIASRDAAVEESKRDALIETLNQAGKLAPALNGWAKTQTLVQLTSFGDAAPASAVATEIKTEAPSAAGSDIMSEVEINLCAQFGQSHEDFIAARKTNV